jgi:hypothetical protein
MYAPIIKKKGCTSMAKLQPFKSKAMAMHSFNVAFSTGKKPE